MNDLTLIHTGDSIFINRIASLLNENGIPSLINDIQESARVAGFGVPDHSIELYVNKSDVPRAQKLIQDYQGRKSNA